MSKKLSLLLGFMLVIAMFGTVMAENQKSIWNNGNALNYKTNYYLENHKYYYYYGNYHYEISIEKFELNMVYTLETGDLVEIDGEKFQIVYLNGEWTVDAIFKVPDDISPSGGLGDGNSYSAKSTKYFSVSQYLQGSFEGVRYYTEKIELARQIIDAKMQIKSSIISQSPQTNYLAEKNIHQEINYDLPIPEYLSVVGETIDFETIMTTTTIVKGKQSSSSYGNSEIPISSAKLTKSILTIKSECLNGEKVETELGTYDTNLINTITNKAGYDEYPNNYYNNSFGKKISSYDTTFMNFISQILPYSSDDMMDLPIIKNEGRVENYYSKEDGELVKSIQYDVQGNKISMVELTTSNDKTKMDNILMQYYAMIGVFILIFAVIIAVIVYKNKKNLPQEEYFAEEHVQIEEILPEENYQQIQTFPQQQIYQQPIVQPQVETIKNYVPINLDYLQLQKIKEFSPKVKKLKCPDCKEVFEETIVQRMQLVYCPNCGKKGIVM